MPGADVNPYLALAALIAGGLHGVELGLPLEPPVSGNAYADRPPARAGHAARRARPVRRQRGRARGVRRRGRRPLPQQRARRARGVRRRGHRLGARPRLRAAVDDGERPRATRRWTRSSRRSARRRRSRRRSTGSGPRSSSACSSPGTRLPPERELCSRLGIARSTLRQALTALTESGHLYAVRGRGGGTFVADPLPPADRPGDELLARWREVCDVRLAVELGVVGARLPARRRRRARRRSASSSSAWTTCSTTTRPSARPTCASTSGWPRPPAARRLVAAMTEAQGEMTDLISHIPHPPEVLLHSNEQHAQILAAVRARRRGARARRSWPTTCTAPSTCSPACCPAPEPAGPLRPDVEPALCDSSLDFRPRAFVWSRRTRGRTCRPLRVRAGQVLRNDRRTPEEGNRVSDQTRADGRRRTASRRAGLQAGADRGAGAGSRTSRSRSRSSRSWPGCFTTYDQAWNNGGPIAISWGWPIISLFILIIAFCMAELVSAYPTAGGIYWWAVEARRPGLGLVHRLVQPARPDRDRRLGRLLRAASSSSVILGLYNVDIFGMNFARRPRTIAAPRRSCCSSLILDRCT